MRRAGLDREGLSVHALWHACATHLLAHGVELRHVQEFLVHSSVQTSVRYTSRSVLLRPHTRVANGISDLTSAVDLYILPLRVPYPIGCDDRSHDTYLR